jgi:hypothetical protein
LHLLQVQAKQSHGCKEIACHFVVRHSVVQARRKVSQKNWDRLLAMTYMARGLLCREKHPPRNDISFRVLF